MVERKYSYGIYGYIDTENDNKIVYIGQDSHISEGRRNKQHHERGRYDKQPINSILQNNPGRYEYKVLKKDIGNKDDLNKLEISYIEKYDTYTTGFNYTEGGENNPKYWLGKPRSEEDKHKISEANNSTGYYRVSKQIKKACKNGFTWRYQYYDENGKHKSIYSVNLSKLMLKVISKGLPWEILDIDKARNSIKENGG